MIGLPPTIEEVGHEKVRDGIKPGTTLGATDDLGFHVTEKLVHVDDIQATCLCLLDLDHTRLTCKSPGRDFRLTDVGGAFVGKLLA